MKQELYINGQKADIKDDSLILFTYQQSDYSDPTAVKNSYTKSVTLPGTPNNHRIFNEIYRLDYAQNDQVFNPSKRTQFEILSNGNLLEQGYIKLTKITGQGEYREYQISLYGGLGDFMYSLQYNYEGNKISLYDIISYDYVDLDFRMDRDTVKEAWDWINGDRKTYSNWGDINFAPCYNGIPENENFDPKKIALFCGMTGHEFDPTHITIYKGDNTRKGLPSQFDGYSGFHADDCYWSLIEVGDDMDEWQVEDHRSWMQRPIFSVKFLFNMIESYLRETVNPKFEIIKDGAWFNDNNPYWNDLWITLPLLYENKEDVKTGDLINHEILFKNTKTPYEYLTSYTKSFGLWYDYDVITRKLTIRPRYRFYDREIKDITNKIDMSNVKIDPLSFSFRTLKYDWKEGEDNITEEYKKKTGDNYGVYGIDTGWEFDNSSKTVPTNQIMKSAVDIREKSIYFSTLQLIYDDDTHQRTYEIMPPWFWQSEIKYTLYKNNNVKDNLVWEELRPYLNSPSNAVLTQGYEINGVLTGELNRDGVARPKFCDDENKSVDGSDVFLLYTGKSPSRRFVRYSGSNKYDDLPTYQNSVYVTDDIPLIGDITDGKQCWINTVLRTFDTATYPYPVIAYATAVTMPKFNRMDMTDKTVDWSLDFGKPAQTYVYSDIVYPESSSISRKTFLDRYISDLYNVNTRLVETKMKVEDPHKAMRTVYYFSNSLWVINKMTDFNYETNLTTVQFIKVNDIKNYIIDFWVSPSTYTCDYASEILGLDFGVDDYEYITWTTDVDWLTVVRNKIKKPTLFIKHNAGDITREGHVWFSYGTNMQKITITQTGK